MLPRVDSLPRISDRSSYQQRDQVLTWAWARGPLVVAVDPPAAVGVDIAVVVADIAVVAADIAVGIGHKVVFAGVVDSRDVELVVFDTVEQQRSYRWQLIHRSTLLSLGRPTRCQQLYKLL